MAFIYNLSIRAYAFFLFLIQGFHPKAKAWIQGRKNYWRKLPTIPKNTSIYWFHCASLGEFDQGIPVMNLLKERNPNCKILVTFFSPSGMEHYHKRTHTADFVFYLPIDTSRNAKKLLTHFNPKAVYFIKYEFWLNYIFEIKKRQIPLYSISCILRPSQVFFRWYGSYFRKGLKAFDDFYVQNKETKNLLEEIGIKRVIITGDTRFDRVLENKKLVTEDLVIKDFLQGQKAIILGSSWPVEEQLFHRYYSQRGEKIIIAPHDISENHLQSIEKLFQNSIIRYSNYTNDKDKSILLVDSIGKLANAYAYGKIAFIGGGFTGKLHNTLEPVVFGLPVIFGPIHTKFPEAQQFINAGVGFSIQTHEEFSDVIVYIESHLQELQAKCIREIENSKGAAAKIMER
jgi:3-deoxy-D-manno-octulosonic-acid transferase